MVTRVTPSLKVGEVRLCIVQSLVVFVTIKDRPSYSRAGPLDRYGFDSVAARIARRTQESLFCPSPRAVNKKRHEIRVFVHFFCARVKKPLRNESIMSFSRAYASRVLSNRNEIRCLDDGKIDRHRHGYERREARFAEPVSRSRNAQSLAFKTLWWMLTFSRRRI
jgi:hypothetical protein